MHTGRECDELCVLYSVILLLMKEEEGEKKTSTEEQCLSN